MNKALHYQRFDVNSYLYILPNAPELAGILQRKNEAVK